MRTLFIEAKSKIDISKILKKIKLKGKIGLITTVQFLPQLKKANKILKNSIIGGQILGCNISNALKIKKKIDNYLFIGSAYFHPIEIALRTNKPVYIANPYTNKISKINQEEIKKRKKQIKGSYLKFLNAEKVGILVSTKPGQYNLKKALELKKKLRKPSFIFLFNTLNLDELENFPGINCWINTACPRIESNNIINIEDVSPNFSKDNKL